MVEILAKRDKEEYDVIHLYGSVRDLLLAGEDEGTLFSGEVTEEEVKDELLSF